jgi:RNA polymerase sigma-70 factor (ECF subfamily)
MDATDHRDGGPAAGWGETRDRLGRFIAARVADPADAEDVLHDVLERAVARLPQLRRADSLHAWLYGIARNAIIDHYRRRARVRTDGDTDLDRLPAPEPEADGAADLLACLEPMLRGLDARDREVLTLADMHGVAQKDLPGRLGLSYSGAKSRVQRARHKLRARFEACCALERDARGGVVGMDARDGRCGRGDDPCCGGA